MLKYYFLGIFLLFAAPCKAYESDSTKKRTTPFIRYRFLADGNVATGNVQRTLISFRSEVAHSDSTIEVVFSPRFVYGKQNSRLVEREYYGDLNFHLYHHRVVYGFALVVAEQSNLRAIRLRSMMGGGIGFHILRKQSFELSFTNGFLYEKTNYEEFETRQLWRNSSKIKWIYRFGKTKMTVRQVLFIQPSISNVENFRWSTNFSVELPLSKHLSLRSSIDNSYESVVVPTRRSNDFRITWGFVVNN